VDLELLADLPLQDGHWRMSADLEGIPAAVTLHDGFPNTTPYFAVYECKV